MSKPRMQLLFSFQKEKQEWGQARVFAAGTNTSKPAACVCKRFVALTECFVSKMCVNQKSEIPQSKMGSTQKHEIKSSLGCGFWQTRADTRSWIVSRDRKLGAVK